MIITVAQKRIALILAVLMTVAIPLAVASGCGNASKGGKGVQGPIIDGKEAYHVIVAGGEPEGIAAAVAAARNGMRTLLVEKGEALGGLMTLGMLNFLDMNYGADQTLLTQGFFKEFFDAVGDAFDIQEAKDWFLKICDNEPNLTVMLNTDIIGPIMDGNTIAGLEIREHGRAGPETIRSLTVIDSTVDGDVAAAAGAPYTLGGEDRAAHGIKQGVTLIFELSGVEWPAVVDYLKNDGNPNSGVNEVCAWGYGEEAKRFVPTDGNLRFRGPNIARQKNGNVILNALVIFGVDALDPDSLNEGIRRGRQEITHIVSFIRENFTGFQNAEFVRNAPRLYVRETRHFIGEYRLTVTDVLENRDHWDRIGHGKYPVDLQPTTPENFGVIIGVPAIYSIPFRCLVPLEIDGLLIASRSASYDSLPHGSTRVLPIGMVVGEAAGTAVAYSVEHGVTFRQMAHDPQAVSWLQDQLISQGAYLAEYDPPRIADMDHWAYPGLVVMRELGMASGGYTNDYQLDSAGSGVALQVRAVTILEIVNERTLDRGEYQVPIWYFEIEPGEVTVAQVLITVAECASLGDREWIRERLDSAEGSLIPMPFESAESARDYLIERGVLKASLLSYYNDPDMTATNGQLQSILGALYLTLMEE